jgi:hypothetical protein
VKLERKTVTVKLNGEVVIDEEEIDGPTTGHIEGKENKPGPFMLRGGGKMDGVTFRNFKVTPLGVE